MQRLQASGRLRRPLLLLPEKTNILNPAALSRRGRAVHWTALGKRRPPRRSVSLPSLAQVSRPEDSLESRIDVLSLLLSATALWLSYKGQMRSVAARLCPLPARFLPVLLLLTCRELCRQSPSDEAGQGPPARCGYVFANHINRFARLGLAPRFNIWWRDSAKRAESAGSNRQPFSRRPSGLASRGGRPVIRRGFRPPTRGASGRGIRQSLTKN